MGQEEVLKFLQKANKPLTRKQIADSLDLCPERVSTYLSSLVIWGDVKYIELDQKEARKFVDYKLYRRTRFFVINK